MPSRRIKVMVRKDCFLCVRMSVRCVWTVGACLHFFGWLHSFVEDEEFDRRCLSGLNSRCDNVHSCDDRDRVMRL